MQLESLYEKYDLDSRLIVNSHVHLPQFSAGTSLPSAEDGHALLPQSLVRDTLALIEPETYLEVSRPQQGISVLLPVERHNIHGEASLLYCSNQRILALAAAHPENFIPFCSLDMSSEDAPAVLDALHSSGMLGVKYHAVEGYPLVAEGRVLPNVARVLDRMQELNMPLTLHLGDTPFKGVDLENARPAMLIPIAKAFPRLRLMITHFGTPMHMEAFWVASCFDNVFYDTAEYPLYWQDHRLNPYGPLLSPLHTMRTGAHKIVFGTDFPMPTLVQRGDKVTLEKHDLSHYIGEFLSLPDLYFTADQKHDILCRNVFRYLGLSREEIVQRNRKIAPCPAT